MDWAIVLSYVGPLAGHIIIGLIVLENDNLVPWGFGLGR